MAQMCFQAKDYRVLLVDDNEINREVALAVLEPYEFQLTEAESGSEALELVRGQIFDMIFMDYLMPGMDGIETTTRIRTECGTNGKSPVIVALTAEETPELLDRFQKSGCQDVLSKPIDSTKLSQLLERWIPEEQRTGMAEPLEPMEMTAEDIASLRMEGVDLEGTGICREKTKSQYSHLLSLFYMDGRKAMSLWQANKLETVWKDAGAEPMEEYRIWVHGLKSAAASIGAMELSAMAREQENATKSKDLDVIREKTPAMFAAYQKILMEIAQVLRNDEKPADESEPALDQETLNAELRQALSLLEDFHAKECAHKVDELLRHRISEETHELLTQVKDKLQMYEDEEAENMLRDYVTHMDQPVQAARRARS
jgi:CheY-like chemotaxis protein/HPt (histidine-containing phosphotransfer) domain-containing protein